MTSVGKRWLLTTGDDGRQHVIYRPEVHRHITSMTCICHPEVEAGVVVHTVLTRARQLPMMGTQLEH